MRVRENDQERRIERSFRFGRSRSAVVVCAARSPSRTQNFALDPAIGASVDSPFFYTRMKGELEQDVREIGLGRSPSCGPASSKECVMRFLWPRASCRSFQHFLARVRPKRFRQSRSENHPSARRCSRDGGAPGLTVFESPSGKSSRTMVEVGSPGCIAGVKSASHSKYSMRSLQRIICKRETIQTARIELVSPHHRVVIALHSPETGLPFCRPEKTRDIENS